MHFQTLTSLFLLSATALMGVTNAVPSPVAGEPEEASHGIPPPQCKTCNPVSGENHCHPTTSCINTGTRFHCACRAGYKASKHNHDINKQFRLPYNNFEFLVFTPESTECNVLCDEWMQPAPKLCSEVPLYNHCPA